MRLTESKIQTIINALGVAAEQYEKDAKICADAGGTGEMSRLTVQFEGQAKAARELAYELDQAGTVEVALEEF